MSLHTIHQMRRTVIVAFALLCVFGGLALAQADASAPAGAVTPTPAAAAIAATSVPLIALDHADKVIPLAGQSEFWVDPTGQLGIDDVEARQDSLPFAQRQAQQTHLIDDKSLWIRFDARVTTADVHWQLEAVLPGLDLIKLSYRNAQGQWVTQQAGDSLPQSAWPQRGRYPVFQLASDPQRTVRYYAQIQHARVPFSASLKIGTDKSLSTAREFEQFLLGAYFGLAALVMVMAGAYAVAYRDAGFGSYAVYIGTLALAQAAFTGIAGQYLWPRSPTVTNSAAFLLPLLAAAAGMWFVRTVTAPRQFSVMLDRFILSLAGILVIVSLIDAALPTNEGFAAVNTVLACCMLILVVVIAVSVVEGDHHARWVAVGFSPVLIAAVFPVLRNFGVISSGFLTEYGLTLGSAIEAPILFYALHRRLTERREAQVRARALSQTDPLTGLPNARVLALRLQSAMVRARRYSHRCALLVLDLSNHGQLQQEHGRETADRSLVLAASRLRKIITDVDIASRVGEHYFALLVEGPVTGPEAQAVATHAIARGLADSELLPGGEHLKFRVALALLPEGERDADQVLHWLLEEVREMAQDPRKPIRMLSH